MNVYRTKYFFSSLFLSNRSFRSTDLLRLQLLPLISEKDSSNERRIMFLLSDKLTELLHLFLVKRC